MPLLPVGMGMNFDVVKIVYTTVAIFALFGMVLFTGIFMWFQTFSVKVDIIEQFGNGMMVSTRKAKRIEKINGNQLKFLFWKVECPLPAAKYFMPIGKKKYKLTMYKDINGNLNPVELRFDEQKNPLFIPDDSDKRFWLINRLDENKDNYKKDDFWSKYGQAIMIMGIISFATLILVIYGYYFYTGMNTAGVSMANSMAELSKAMHTLAPQLQYQYVQLPNPLNNASNLIPTNPVAVLPNVLGAG